MIGKILTEINRLKDELDGYSAKEGLDYIESYINTLSKQQVKQPSEDLEEAAENYIAPIENDEGLDYINFNGRDIKDAFIAGSEWRYQKDRREFAKLKAKEWSDGYDEGIAKGKEQMLKDAVEGVAQPDDCEIWINLVGYGYKFNDGDKVKIIIVPDKED